MFMIQTILDSLDHMLTNISLYTYKRTFTSYGDKAFANFVPPKLWNKLPVTLRSADKVKQKKFKSMLKTHLFPH